MKKYFIVLILLLSSFLLIDKVNAYEVINVANISSNNNLKNLSISGTDLEYKKSQTVYKVVYSADSDTAKIYATLDDENAKFVDGFGPRTVTLGYGDNEVLVKVQAEDGDIKVYTINIFRKDNRSDNNYLNNIVVNGEALNFDKEKLTYSFSVPYSVSKLDVRVSTVDSKAKATIMGHENLVVGDNRVLISVTAENGESEHYILNVYRSNSENIPLSSNTLLALLKVEGYNLKFDSYTVDYKLTVKDDSPLNIKALAEDEKSTVKIVGNDEIKNNDVIEIRVIAEDGSLEVYKINIVIEGMLKVNKILIVVIVISVVALISLLVIVLSKASKKNNQGPTMNLEVVRQSAPVVETNAEEDQQLMSFLLGGNNNGVNNQQKKCPVCGAVNNSNNVNCTNCGNSLGNINQ